MWLRGSHFNAVNAREGDLRVPKPERPPSRSHPVGHGRSVTSSMCNTVDLDMYDTVFRVGRCADKAQQLHYHRTGHVAPPPRRTFVNAKRSPRPQTLQPGTSLFRTLFFLTIRLRTARIRRILTVILFCCLVRTLRTICTRLALLGIR